VATEERGERDPAEAHRAAAEEVPARDVGEVLGGIERREGVHSEVAARGVAAVVRAFQPVERAGKDTGWKARGTRSGRKRMAAEAFIRA
jgi:hypothetical protein